MTGPRATLRPVGIGHLVQGTHACDGEPATTESLAGDLASTRRRTVEILRECRRLGLVTQPTTDRWDISEVGTEFLAHVAHERWTAAGELLRERSAHYRAFLQGLQQLGPVAEAPLLEHVDATDGGGERAYNITSIQVMADWGERLGQVQRHAFDDLLYPVERDADVGGWAAELVSTYRRWTLDEPSRLARRYLSIPRLREDWCAGHRCSRDLFDRFLTSLAASNVGKVEVSGAPLDTDVKQAVRAIKTIEVVDSDALIATSQSAERVLDGIEIYGKRYYFLAIFEGDLTEVEVQQHE